MNEQLSMLESSLSRLLASYQELKNQLGAMQELQEQVAQMRSEIESLRNENMALKAHESEVAQRLDSITNSLNAAING